MHIHLGKYSKEIFLSLDFMVFLLGAPRYSGSSSASSSSRLTPHGGVVLLSSLCFFLMRLLRHFLALSFTLAITDFLWLGDWSYSRSWSFQKVGEECGDHLDTSSAAHANLIGQKWQEHEFSWLWYQLKAFIFHEQITLQAKLKHICYQFSISEERVDVWTEHKQILKYS